MTTTNALANRPPSPVSDDLDSKIDLEKKEEFQIEEVTGGSRYSEDDEAFLASFDDKRKARMYRKIDMRLLPMLGALYLFACEWS